MGIIGSRSIRAVEASVVGLEATPGLQSDSSPYFWDSDLDSNSNFSDSDFAHETKVKAIHELMVND